VLALLKKRGYPSDPLKAWKAMESKVKQKRVKTDGYNYLLGLSI